jgi:predicted nucleic acid-binding protein
LIVADASAVAELLLAGPQAAKVRAAMTPHPELHVPEHFHVEVLSVLRRYSLRGELSDRRAAVALAALADLRTVSYSAMHLAEAIWDLRAALSAYDAAYLALAARLGAGVITLDRGLAHAASRRGLLGALPG